MKALFSKLKEPSTIRGIAIIGAVAGLSLEPAKWDAIGSALAAIIGLMHRLLLHAQVRLHHPHP